MERLQLGEPEATLQMEACSGAIRHQTRLDLQKGLLCKGGARLSLQGRAWLAGWGQDF